MTTEHRAPARFWTVAIVLLIWEVMGCYACILQIKAGPAAMGPVDDWSRQYYDALPVWYNGVYVVATFGALLGGLALLWRDWRALPLFWISFVAIVVMFGYAFAATDLIAHKGLGRVLPFPVFIAAVGALSIWYTRFAMAKGWVRRRGEKTAGSTR